jgi:hypothetical protein
MRIKADVPVLKPMNRRRRNPVVSIGLARRHLVVLLPGSIPSLDTAFVTLGGLLMNRRSALGLCAFALLAIPAFPDSGLTQGMSVKDQLIGTWIYVSSTGKRDDGSAVPRPTLQGAVTYTADGRFHFITTRTDVPKYASSDPSRPTAEEAMAIASGSVAYTGTYTVDENTKTVHVNVETSTFPNLVGAPNQRRIITSITADEMKFTNPRTPAG